MKQKKIVVEVLTTPGYQQRFTAACLDQLKRREKIIKFEEKGQYKTLNSKGA